MRRLYYRIKCAWCRQWFVCMRCHCRACGEACRTNIKRNPDLCSPVERTVIGRRKDRPTLDAEGNELNPPHDPGRCLYCDSPKVGGRNRKADARDKEKSA